MITKASALKNQLRQVPVGCIVSSSMEPTPHRGIKLMHSRRRFTPMKSMREFLNYTPGLWALSRQWKYICVTTKKKEEKRSKSTPHRTVYIRESALVSHHPKPKQLNTKTTSFTYYILVHFVRGMLFFSLLSSSVCPVMRIWYFQCTRVETKWHFR